MKVPLCTSVASVFIELQNLFSSENDRTRLIFTPPRVVLTLNRNFKMAVDLLERKLYMWKFVHSYTILDEESEFTFTFPQKSRDNIFKTVSLSVKRSIGNSCSYLASSYLARDTLFSNVKTNHLLYKPSQVNIAEVSSGLHHADWSTILGIVYCYPISFLFWCICLLVYRAT